MKLKKCPNNHFYNADEHKNCPQCALLKEKEPITKNPHITDKTDSVINTGVSAEFSVAVISASQPIAQSGSTDMKTVAMWNAPTGSEPVVGWLVCIKGTYMGQSFILKTGNNNIGRSMDMDVPLAQENTVSRNRHCIITFEPEKQEFFIQPGESSGLTYLNGELALTIVKLSMRDKIKLGNCEFVFFPLCDGKFNWKDLI